MGMASVLSALLGLNTAGRILQAVFFALAGDVKRLRLATAQFEIEIF